MKGYIAIYIVKAVTEKNGKFDQKAFIATMHGVRISAKENPACCLMSATTRTEILIAKVT